jgi:hypothetical protein
MQPVKLVSVRLLGQVNSLNSFWNTPQRFIFKGVELNPTMTFLACRLQDGDALIVLSAADAQNVTPTNHWMSLSRDHEGFNDSVRWMLDSTTAAEAGRLRDLHLMRLESRSPRFITIYMSYMNMMNNPCCDSVTTASYESPTAPSTEALPIVWRSEETLEVSQ